MVRDLYSQSALVSVIWGVADGVNIAAVTCFGIVHAKNDGYTYGQAFWMTLCSTIVSTITNINLVMDYVRVRDFARSGTCGWPQSTVYGTVSSSPPGSGLTRKQRSLVILVIILLMYLALGALINAELLGISYINGLYFSTVCIEVIGFGDIVPRSTGARVFVCGYIACGMVILGTVISITRDTVLEGLEVGYRKRLQNMRARRAGARRFRHWQRRWRDAVTWRLRAQNKPVWVSDTDWQHGDDAVRFVGLGGPGGGGGREPLLGRALEALGLREPPPSDPSMRPAQHVPGHPRGMHLNINALTHSELEAAALEAGVPLNQFTEVSEARQIAASGGRPTGQGPLPDGGWPAQVGTPTDAQVGRMAAMLTEVSLAMSGRDIRLPGPSAQDRSNARAAVVEEHADRGDEQRRNEANDAFVQREGEATDSAGYAAESKWVSDATALLNQRS